MTPRERDVLALIADGWSQSEIATRLEIRPNTVRHHLESTFKRLGAQNAVHAIALMDDQQPGWRGPAHRIDQ